MIDLVSLIAGAGILIVAGDLLVSAAIALSLRLGLSAALVSLTVVALGTSAPELLVSVRAALEGAPDIALGNVVGSNIANILLVLGVPALILALGVSDAEARFNYVLMCAATLLFAALALFDRLDRVGGAILLVALIAALTLSYRRSLDTPPELDVPDGMSGARTAIYLVIGVVGLPVGATLLVDGARGLAEAVGVSEAAIGLTVVALGTSLPELAASVAAARRGRTDVAVANVVGSNILNLLAIIGATAMIAPLSVAPTILTVDIPVMIGVSVLLGIFLVGGMRIGKGAGTLFIALYAVFVALALGDATL